MAPYAQTFGADSDTSFKPHCWQGSAPHCNQERMIPDPHLKGREMQKCKYNLGCYRHCMSNPNMQLFAADLPPTGKTLQRKRRVTPGCHRMRNCCLLKNMQQYLEAAGKSMRCLWKTLSLLCRRGLIAAVRMLSCPPDTTRLNHTSAAQTCLFPSLPFFPLPFPTPLQLPREFGGKNTGATVDSRQYQHFPSTRQCCCSAWKGTSEHRSTSYCWGPSLLSLDLG